MSATLVASVGANIAATYTGSPANNSIDAPINYNYSRSLSNGTGALGTADLLYAINTTIAASSSATYDLVGSLTDFFGTTISMARLKYMFIKLTTDTTSSDISIGNATNPVAGWISSTTATVKIHNDGVFLIGSPSATAYPMTGGASDEIKITNNDASNIATIYAAFIGSSA